MPNRPGTQGTTTATLQTPPGRGGIAVIALAGPRTNEILAGVFRPYPSHRRVAGPALQLGHLVDRQTVIDEAVLCRTDRGAEINIHGGPVVAQSALQLLARRGAAIQPAAGHDGGHCPFDRPHPRWNNPGLAREMLEALDLAKSALVVSAVTQQWSGGLSELASDPHVPAAALRRAADGLETMRRLLQPGEVVLVGPPNAGKSTLANALWARQASIVHDEAGTTRDWVRELALLRGVPIRLTDTAGIWSAPVGIDAEAVRRARHRAEQADLVLLLAAGRPVAVPGWLDANALLRVATQCDVARAPAGADVGVSAHTRAGLEELAGAILERLGLADLDPTAAMAFTPRQADLLAQAAECARRRDAPGQHDALRRLLAG